jgi:hypothetical protein
MSGPWPEERWADGAEETGPWSFEEDSEYGAGGYSTGEYGAGGYSTGEYGAGGYSTSEYGAGGYGAGGYGAGGYGASRYQGGSRGGSSGGYRTARPTGEPRKPRKKPRPGSPNGPWPELSMLAAVAVIIAAVALAVTSAHPGEPAPGPAATTSLGSAVGAPAGQGSTASAPTSTTTRAAQQSSTTLPKHPTPRPATRPAPPSAENLVVPDQVRQALVSSWLAANPGSAGLGPKDVAGITKGQLYYGYQPGPGIYWALAQFEPSARLRAEASTAAGQEALAQFRGSTYVFSWKPGTGNWTLIGQVPTGSCPGQVPRAILAVWALCGLRPPVKAPASHQHG